MSVKLNYGKFEIPERLQEVILLQKDLDKKGLLPYGDLLGLYYDYEGVDSRYLNTPLDVISFARPGIDGIHFGFLTDFGSVSDLHNAYIVRVSPMDFDDPVKIVARNLEDFLSIAVYTPHVLDAIELSSSPEDVEKYIKQSEEYSDENRRTVVKAVQEALQLQPIESLSYYLQKVNNEREESVQFRTKDGVGVVSHIEKDAEKTHSPFQLERGQTLDLIRVRDFFEHAPPPFKIRVPQGCTVKSIAIR
ncbi:hypothetical protein LCL90_13655 [Bacillus infantis]|uniref:hypothetical protein n=1 Tax=Bacillus infantis TaxID=324767 RepID=UPI001CD4B39D|nr:hypothetical protein [Bacillus infantis]MCA1035680.1 hypothetical protein [Bacillus infantis]